MTKNQVMLIILGADNYKPEMAHLRVAVRAHKLTVIAESLISRANCWSLVLDSCRNKLPMSSFYNNSNNKRTSRE